MPKPPMQFGRDLTGRFRLRKGWYRTVVLEVEITNRWDEKKWIDANEGDVWRLNAMIQRTGEIPTFAMSR